MPHLHLSLQSGSGLVLKRMRRRHGPAERAGGDRRAPAGCGPDVAIGADLIAGFPTETDALAAETERFVAEAAIPYLHVFPYSERPGHAGRPHAGRSPARAAGAGGPAARHRGRRRRRRSMPAQTRLQSVTVLAERGGRGHTEAVQPRRSWMRPPGALVRARVTGADAAGLLAERGLVALGGFFSKLKAGLTRSTEKLTGGHDGRIQQAHPR